MNLDEILKAIDELRIKETNNSVGVSNDININNMISAIDRLKKVPTYNDLLLENKKLNDKWSDLKDIATRKMVDGSNGIYAHELLIIMSNLERNHNTEIYKKVKIIGDDK